MFQHVSPSACPFLTSWRLEEYRRNYTYDCENYDCHVQPEQQRCAHPINKTQQQNMTIFLEAKLPWLNCDWVKQSLKSTDWRDPWNTLFRLSSDVMETSRGKCLVTTTTISFLRFVTNSVYVITDIANKNTAYDLTFTKLSWLSPWAVNLDTMPPRSK